HRDRNRDDVRVPSQGKELIAGVGGSGRVGRCATLRYSPNVWRRSGRTRLVILGFLVGGGTLVSRFRGGRFLWTRGGEMVNRLCGPGGGPGVFVFVLFCRRKRR